MSKPDACEPDNVGFVLAASRAGGVDRRRAVSPCEICPRGRRCATRPGPIAWNLCGIGLYACTPRGLCFGRYAFAACFSDCVFGRSRAHHRECCHRSVAQRVCADLSRGCGPGGVAGVEARTRCRSGGMLCRFSECRFRAGQAHGRCSCRALGAIRSGCSSGRLAGGLLVPEHQYAAGPLPRGEPGRESLRGSHRVS